MNNNYIEKFEKMRAAGKLAAQTLDMIAEFIKPGVSTNKIDQLCYDYIKDNGGYSAPLYYRGYNKSLCNTARIVILLFYCFPINKHIRTYSSKI